MKAVRQAVGLYPKLPTRNQEIQSISRATPQYRLTKTQNRLLIMGAESQQEEKGEESEALIG